MDKMDAYLWLATFQLAKEGSKKDQEAIDSENQMREEDGRPSLEEELIAMAKAEGDQRKGE